MICDECVHQWECWDQRGFCNQFRSKEELRREIEKLNEDHKKAARNKRTDEGSIQKAGDRGGKVYQGTSERVQTEAGADPEAAAKAGEEGEGKEREETG